MQKTNFGEQPGRKPIQVTPLSRACSSKERSKSAKEESNSVDPDMPHLEKLPTKVEVGKWSNPSESVSTGSTNSLFDGKLKEICGRFAAETEVSRPTHKKERAPISREEKSNRSSSEDHSVRTHRVSRPKAKTVKLGKKNKSRGKSQPPHSMSLSSDSKGEDSHQSSFLARSSGSSSQPSHPPNSQSSSRPPHNRKKTNAWASLGILTPRIPPLFNNFYPKGFAARKSVVRVTLCVGGMSWGTPSTPR